MRGWYFPAHVADAFDEFDYLQQRAPNVLEMASNFVIQSVLIGTLSTTASTSAQLVRRKRRRGTGRKRHFPDFYVDNVKAGIEAANMLKDWGGPEYQRLLRLGLDLRGADAGFDVRTKEILRSFTDQLDQDKESNALIAGLVGVKNAAQFIRKLNHEITFGMGDLALAQSFYAKRAELMRDGVLNAEEARGLGAPAGGRVHNTSSFTRLGRTRKARGEPHCAVIFPLPFRLYPAALGDSSRESLGEFKPDEEASEQAGKEVNEFGQTAAGSRRLAIARRFALTAMAVYVFRSCSIRLRRNDER